MGYTTHIGKNKEVKHCCSGVATLSFLTILVVGSLTVATAAVVSLQPEDKISIKRGACLSILGLIFFVSLFDFFNNFSLKTSYGQKLRKKYHLTIADVFDISNKLVSAVQASLSCISGFVVCMWSCTRSFLYSSHFMSEAYAWFGAAYFFYDIWSMYKVYIVSTFSKPQTKLVTNGSQTNVGNCGDQKLKQTTVTPFKRVQEYVKSQPIIIMHHLFIGSFGFLVIVYLRGGLGDCVFGLVYLMELSTPFVSLRGILSKMRLKTSKLYVVNGLVMLATFFFCRVAMFPYVFYVYSEIVNLPYWEAIMSLPRGCKIGISIILLPQVYWFLLMMKGAVKTLRSVTITPVRKRPKNLHS